MRVVLAHSQDVHRRPRKIASTLGCRDDERAATIRDQRAVEQAPRRVQAELCFDYRLVARQPRDHLAAIAPRRTPADLARFENHHLEAAIGQFDRCRQPGETAADDGDVTGQVSLQCSKALVARCRGRVVGVLRQFLFGGEQRHDGVR